MGIYFNLDEYIVSESRSSIPFKVRYYNKKNKTPINGYPDLIKHHENYGLKEYVSRCNSIDELKYIRYDNQLAIGNIQKIKERIEKCKRLGNCQSTMKYYKSIKKNYLDADITEKDCDITIDKLTELNKIITTKIKEIK